jgi:hypothetical protein
MKFTISRISAEAGRTIPVEAQDRVKAVGAKTDMEAA